MTNSSFFLRLAGLACLSLLVPGCPETFSQICPTGTHNEGSYTARFFTVDNPTECKVVSTPDGGALDASLSVPPQPFTASLCSQGLVDGGALIYLAINSNTVPRVSPVGEGSTFTFSSAANVPGTSCGCAIDVSETISGTLLPASGADAGAAYDPDAGQFEALRGFTSIVKDHVDGGTTYPDGGNSCYCNVPCTIEYRLDATR